MIMKKDYGSKRLLTVRYIPDIGDFSAAAFWDGVLISADFDGDGSDEILLNTSVNANMARISRIYKFDGNGLFLFQNLDQYDPGFDYELKPNKEICLSDKKRSININVDISAFSDDAFDSDGIYNIGNNTALNYGNLFSCELLNDNKFTALGTITDSYMNRWCTIKYTFEYDNEHDQMELVGAELTDY